MAAKKTSRAKARKTVTRAKATRKSSIRTGRKSPSEPFTKRGIIPVFETI